MSMVHHDSRDYAVAVSDTAKHFQRKLEEKIGGSVERVQRVIEQVENDVPTDAVARGSKLGFTIATPTNALAIAVANGDPLTIHKHALGQLADRANVDRLRSVVNDLLAANGDPKQAWRKELVAHVLGKIYAHSDERFLLRAVRGELRGFLSDRFRRLDSRPLIDAFIREMQRFGARPVDGFALQTKVNIRAILPYVFEPYPGEIMWFGAQLSDSDFGDGSLSMSYFVDRAYCTNLATVEDLLKQVHLGRRLGDSVEFSQRTLELDTETMRSAVGDVAKHILAPPAINRYLDMVRTANEQKIDSNAITAWVKKNLNKEEGKKVAEKFASADVELLPAGQTQWRFSNAVSWLANETPDEHRKLELQDFAGQLLTKKTA